MAKDPAMLWYWNDWQGGTVTLSRHLKGCYIDILHAQFNNGHLSLDEIRVILGPDFEAAWPTLQKKFQTDRKGLFFNKRLEEEQAKRADFTASRRENAKKHMHKHMVKHMPNHMENENEDENDNRNESENFSEKFLLAFDEITCDRYKMTFGHLDLGAELQQFRMKCDNAPKDYHHRDVNGLRTAFQYQLKNSKNDRRKQKFAGFSKREYFEKKYGSQGTAQPGTGLDVDF